MHCNNTKIKEIFKSSKLAVLSTEIEEISETPVSLFRKLCNKGKCYLLESAETVDKWGRYSYIGRKPFIEVRGYGNEVYIYGKNQLIEKTGNPLGIVKDLMKEYKMPFIDNMPDFIGGAVGYIGYDIIRNYENLSNVNHDDIELPDIHLLFMEEIFIYDHLLEKVLIVFNLPLSPCTKDIDEVILDRLQSIREEISVDDYILKDNQEMQTKEFRYRSNETKETFMDKVLNAKEYIKSGDIFQVVVSQRLQIETNTRPFDVYQTLRDINPSPYMFYLEFNEYSLVGSSPEMLCKVKEGRVETCPIAGTRPRGKTPEEDIALADELLRDEKELAEHLMLVDLARNDIGKISKFGSVELTNYMEIQRYSHVMHIVSNVTGSLRKDLDMFDSLVSCLPAGTVSGAPKIRAMEIIDELESSKRGAYAGAVGCIGFDGNMDTCITIRTIVFTENNAYIQAGAGIVADSDPESEYLETLRKAKALMEAIKITEEDLHGSNNR
ncbi:anthranilate synthase component I [Wukongibacter baidiensis]|uniref:anthranilate synthase component I n=1 Tax=Wukongibacter baidiensis TaxID=1723361 RepID=UPI003D7FA7EB